MKILDRLELIDRIGRELQSRMGYSDIAVFLNAHGVDTKKPTSGVNSKWVYSKELLADEPDARLRQKARASIHWPRRHSRSASQADAE
jgi:hypothetical protein